MLLLQCLSFLIHNSEQIEIFKLSRKYYDENVCDLTDSYTGLSTLNGTF